MKFLDLGRAFVWRLSPGSMRRRYGSNPAFAGCGSIFLCLWSDTATRSVCFAGLIDAAMENPAGETSHSTA